MADEGRRPACWRIAEDVVWAGEETVRLYHYTTGEFRALNITGSAIWRLMAGGADNERITLVLTHTLADGRADAFARISRDVDAFLSTLAEHHIVVAV
jgi:Coenzyme PQQ synthesis protein D (PqqD)